MLAVAVASSRTLEVLDLEGTGLTNQSAQVDLSLHSPAGERAPFTLILDQFFNRCCGVISKG